MSYSVGQLTYSLFCAQAVPGQLADNFENRIVSREAGETIYPGRGLELGTGGVVQQCQQTSTTLNLFGFSVFQSARPGTGTANLGTNVGGAVFNVGEMVPVLRKGAMFANWKGTTQTAGIPNMYHSSTLAADRGKITDAGTSTGAGTEIALCPAWVQVQTVLTGSGDIALVEVNAPGAAS